MNKLTLFTSFRSSLISNNNKLKPICGRWYCKKEDELLESKNEKQNESDDDKIKKRVTRLNSLLKEMIEDSAKLTPSQTVTLAKPTTKFGKLEKILGEEKPPKKPKSVEQNILSAAKEVAESLGGDTKQTESELMKKLLGNTETEKSDTITSLSDIFKGMKIDQEKPQVQQRSRSDQVRQLMKEYKQRELPQRRATKSQVPRNKKQIMNFENIDLYGSEPLGIFTRPLEEYNDNVTNKTWNKLMERELKLAVTHPPANYFQQMILWTEQGKLWKFPIDNEQGLEEESNVSFAEHIFLDKYLEPWCPQKGPLRHFMELVCVGLSKNPYLTVNAKREHIEWYKNYFEDKKALLQGIGVKLNKQTALK